MLPQRRQTVFLKYLFHSMEDAALIIKTASQLSLDQ